MNPNPHPNPATQALRSYFWQFGLSILAYLIALIVIGYFVPIHAMAKPWRILIALLPIIPIIFAFVAFLRFVRDTDELKRQIIVHSLAIAGGVNIFFFVICGLLAIAGIPNPSAFCAFCVFNGSWAIASILLHRHYYNRCG
jgi:hypothetical protein